MNKIIKLFILTLACTIHTTYPKQSLISKMYCSIFGNNDVRPEYKQKVHQALKDLGVAQPLDVPVKQMNIVGPSFARYKLASFTAFGIWLDEAYLNRCNEEEKMFHIYHEASHYVQKHHQKNIAGCSGTLMLTLAGLLALKKALGSTNPLIKNVTVAGTTILAIIGGCRYLLPYFVKRQEKQADLMAAKILMSTEKEYIVDAHIEK